MKFFNNSLDIEDHIEIRRVRIYDSNKTRNLTIRVQRVFNNVRFHDHHSCKKGAVKIALGPQ